jgi:pSer/pThr/pTyr-binding forkhead associated (FHA) protein
MDEQKRKAMEGLKPTGETRRILGVLITYSWRPEGELFAIREGKNFIGRGNDSRDKCEVKIPLDERMSSLHALILCRGGRFELIDHESANGTFLDDRMLLANESNELRDHALIRTGDTIWKFYQIKAPAS